MTRNALYAQSGGVTAVINASACGMIETARKYPDTFGKIFAAHNGVIGVLQEDIIDTASISEDQLKSLYQSPSGCFGSCRYKLGDLEKHQTEYSRILEVFKAHDIGYFFYNGGNDSMDTAHKIAQLAASENYPLTCIGIPKTIDNDLPFTDCCPGFGSVAKYVAIATLEASMDIAAMARSSTKVFILEVMGRHAGWIAAATGLASKANFPVPHIILLPEVPFILENFLEKVQNTVNQHEYCVITASEGTRTVDGHFITKSTDVDAFGHKKLGGVASILADHISARLGYKYHYAIADYLQRSAGHIVSKTDLEQAYAVGKAAVEFAKNNKNAIMPTIVREQNFPYKWKIDSIPLQQVANQERKLPQEFISTDGYGITEQCRKYLLPLIQGESYPSYTNGVPDYYILQPTFIPKKCS